ncbi:hypothetical protein [Salipaludibacillus sp. CF4.18]|uniref:hypothetical protein n=1 Tax=Salipaludibacillus sp. CF4.18 TaxID=3373081 RepID=UPI003EE5AF12
MNGREKLENEEWLVLDPLYTFCMGRDRLRDKIFPDFLEEIKADETFSTGDVSGYLKKSDANLRYYLRELYEYIRPEFQGRRYRLNVESFYKLYLVSVCLDDGQSVHDIAARLNLKTTIQPSGRDHQRVGNSRELMTAQEDDFRNQMLDLKQRMLMMENEKQIFMNKKLFKLHQAEKKTNALYREINEIDKQISDVDKQKQLDLLEKTVGRNNDLTVKVYRQTLENKKRGFLDWFKKKEVDEEIDTESLYKKQENEEANNLYEDLVKAKSEKEIEVKMLEEQKKEIEGSEYDKEEQKRLDSIKKALDEHDRPRYSSEPLRIDEEDY